MRVERCHRLASTDDEKGALLSFPFGKMLLTCATGEQVRLDWTVVRGLEIDGLLAGSLVSSRGTRLGWAAGIAVRSPIYQDNNYRGRPIFLHDLQNQIFSMGSKLTEEVLEVLNGGKIPDGWNETVIALIQKVENVEKVTELRPISLCNVLYKVVSKVLSRRLRDVLPEIITPFQSAFVPDRLISDNILVAYELTHYLLNKREGDVGYAAI